MASIDFISVPLSSFIRTTEEAAPRLSVIEKTGARYEWPEKPSINWEGDFLSIHDATPATIAYLVNEHGSHRVRDIEISLDYFLRDGSNDPARLLAMHRYLVHCLCPGHGLIRKAYRPTGPDSGHYERDGLETKNQGTSVIWEHVYKAFKVRLYIKTQDNKKPIERHSVRLEINLEQTELEREFNPDDGEVRLSRLGEDGPFRLHMLPRLFRALRRYLTGFLYVAEGIAPKLQRTRAIGTRAKRIESANVQESSRVSNSWQRYGAAWASRHGYRVKPNVGVNDDIGRALTELQRQVEREIARKTAHVIPDQQRQMR